MQGFLGALLGFPAVAYTVALGAVMIYWAAVVVGAIDLDDGDGAGADHGDLGDADGHDAGDHDADDGHDAGEHDGGGVLDALGAIELRRVPLTVRVSLVVIFGWLVSVMGWVLTARVFPGPAWALRALLTLASVILGVRLAGWAARPLVPVFTPKRAISQEDLAGRDAEVTTGRVDGRFGQVLVRDGGAGLLVDARYDGAAALKKGDRVLVTHWDADRKVVNVEPLDGPDRRVRVATATAGDDGDVAGSAAGEVSARRAR